MNYIAISDVHLGHKRTPTEHIIKNLKEYLLVEENNEIDVMFINGDLFDRLLDLNNEEVHLIIGFFNDLLNYCFNKNIKLRVLEGTPSHDWCQNFILVKMNDIRTNKVNLKYFRILDIEHFEDTNEYVLYIPDEWCNNHDELEKQIQKKLDEYNIDKVDYAMLHGQFEYQLAGYKSLFFFKEEYFLKIVKKYIHVGHYHIYSNLDRIYANGSFDRLAFGEEGKKGYIRVINDNIEFIENKNAYIYKSYLIEKNKDIERVYKDIFKLRKNSYIRLQLSENVDYDINRLKTDFIDYNIKIQRLGNVNVQINEQIDEDIKINTFNIENLKEYLRNNILSKNSLDENSINILDSYLEKFV